MGSLKFLVEHQPLASRLAGNYLHRSAHQVVVFIYEHSFMLIKYLRFNCLINGISPRIVNLGSQLGIGAMLDSCADFFLSHVFKGEGNSTKGEYRTPK